MRERLGAIPVTALKKDTLTELIAALSIRLWPDEAIEEALKRSRRDRFIQLDQLVRSLKCAPSAMSPGVLMEQAKSGII